MWGNLFEKRVSPHPFQKLLQKGSIKSVRTLRAISRREAAISRDAQAALYLATRSGAISRARKCAYLAMRSGAISPKLQIPQCTQAPPRRLSAPPLLSEEGFRVSTAPGSPPPRGGMRQSRRGERACTKKSPLPCDAPLCTHPPFARSATSFAPQVQHHLCKAQHHFREAQHHLHRKVQHLAPTKSNLFKKLSKNT